MMIGLLGGGQLGRMLALAGSPLGLRFRALDHNPDAPVRNVAELMTAEFDDLKALERFAEGLDLVSFEFENVPVESVRFLNERVPVFPPPDALEWGQDRLLEKSFFQRLGIQTARFSAVRSRPDLERAAGEIGLPAVLKTRRLGYDGKGQFLLRTPEDIPTAWNSIGSPSLILESFVPFEREVSILAVRGRKADTAFYPLVENHHEGGILRLSLAPAPDLSLELQAWAEDCAARVLEALDYVGVLAIEFFLYEGQLYANEFAPRVHNSGHWTIEGAETSQFENHLRAILGFPLGSTAAVGHSAMINLIGTVPDPRSVLAVRDTHLHLYDKAPKPGRKLGHITTRRPDPESREIAVVQIHSLLRG
jgi:5-(carboxyamino)imidazole ribonucleotide synthase